LRKQRAFALAGFLTAVGFVVSLNLINVDGLIVKQNFKLAINSGIQGNKEETENTNQELDTFYLNSLSTDSTPALIRAHQNQQLSESERDQLAAVLACQIVEISDRRTKQTWQSYHLADERAWQLLTTHRADFRVARVYRHADSWWVMVHEERRPCYPGAFGFD
jgi:hypothetical protein